MRCSRPSGSTALKRSMRAMPQFPRRRSCSSCCSAAPWRSPAMTSAGVSPRPRSLPLLACSTTLHCRRRSLCSWRVGSGGSRTTCSSRRDRSRTGRGGLPPCLKTGRRSTRRSPIRHACRGYRPACQSAWRTCSRRHSRRTAGSKSGEQPFPHRFPRDRSLLILLQPQRHFAHETWIIAVGEPFRLSGNCREHVGERLHLGLGVIAQHVRCNQVLSARARVTDADSDAAEIGAEARVDRAQPVMSGGAAAHFYFHLEGREVELVVEYREVVHVEFIEVHRLLNGVTAVVHECLRLQQQDP